MKGLIALFVALLMIGAALIWVSAPCSFFKYSSLKDIPGRCISVVEK